MARPAQGRPEPLQVMLVSSPAPSGSPQRDKKPTAGCLCLFSGAPTVGATACAPVLSCAISEPTAAAGSPPPFRRGGILRVRRPEEGTRPEGPGGVFAATDPENHQSEKRNLTRLTGRAGVCAGLIAPPDRLEVQKAPLVQELGISGAPALSQSPETLLVQTDQRASVSCEIKLSTTTYGIYWFRLLGPPGSEHRYEFLLQSDAKGGCTYGQGINATRVAALRESSRSTLVLQRAKPADSGTYICTIVTGPVLQSGSGTRVKVVDVLPTMPTPTKKTTPKRKMCPKKLPDVTQQDGPSCSVLPLSLLVGCILILLISLIVILRINYLWHVARHHFVKQLQR
ncbi:T-cell surface glycoprotein CD8 beta chain [Gracilinanus agilis]|uniref:T-cell surface glycoprotein CD8 beta chain n=1 Tax=Gracilinanus agilis TaxID=191870 RepID=UPI001CFE2BB2|nr:T-cell surface glycoprotein CD8 beta chain [Gracilinanus agilis]